MGNCCIIGRAHELPHGDASERLPAVSSAGGPAREHRPGSLGALLGKSPSSLSPPELSPRTLSPPPQNTACDALYNTLAEIRKDADPGPKLRLAIEALNGHHLGTMAQATVERIITIIRSNTHLRSVDKNNLLQLLHRQSTDVNTSFPYSLSRRVEIRLTESIRKELINLRKPILQNELSRLKTEMGEKNIKIAPSVPAPGKEPAQDDWTLIAATLSSKADLTQQAREFFNIVTSALHQGLSMDKATLLTAVELLDKAELQDRTKPTLDLLHTAILDSALLSDQEKRYCLVELHRTVDHMDGPLDGSSQNRKFPEFLQKIAHSVTALEQPRPSSSAAAAINHEVA